MQLKEFVNEYYLPSLTDLRESTKVGYESAIRLHADRPCGETSRRVPFGSHRHKGGLPRDGQVDVTKASRPQGTIR